MEQPADAASSVSPSSWRLLVSSPVLVPAVAPKAEDVGSVWELGVIENLMPRSFPIHMTFAFEPHSMSFTALRDSLSQVLNCYPQLAGRIAPSAEAPAGHYAITLSNAGAVWLEAEVNPAGPALTLAQLVPPLSVRCEESDAGYALDFPPEVCVTSHTSAAAHDNAMLMVQATRLSCGSVLLDICTDHAAFDASSYFHFVNACAAAHRAGSTAGQQPDKRDSMAQPVHGSSLIAEKVQAWQQQQQLAASPIKFDHSADYRIGAFLPSPPIAPIPPTRCTYHRFTAAALARLKAVLMDGVRGLSVEDAAALSLPPFFSTQDALLSHLWSVTNEARQLKDTGAQHLIRLNISCRDRFQPPLPDGYTGPAALCCAVPVPSRIACQRDSRCLRHFVQRAACIRNRLLQMGQHDYLCSLLLQLGSASPCEVREAIDCIRRPDLMTTSWSSFPVFSCEFAAGRPPCAVRKVIPQTAWNCITILPAAGDEGGVDVCIKLLAADHERMVCSSRLYDFTYTDT